MKKIASAFVLVALSAVAQAQFINEVYVDHQGTDDQEYIELCGVAGSTLNGYVLISVEGDQPSNGFMDRAWNLSGLTFPDDGGGLGYIVIGDPGVANVDLAPGPPLLLESGTQTLFLLQAGSADLILLQLGNQVDSNGDLVMDLASIAGTSVTIFDMVGIVDNGYPSDVLYNNAPAIGPDIGGPNFTDIPAGIFREEDHTGEWCDETWLDWLDTANIDQPRTPGATNTAVCGAVVDPWVMACEGSGCPCSNDNPNADGAGCANSSGSGGLLEGGGTGSVTLDNLVLSGSQLPLNFSGLFYMGNAQVQNNFFDGFQCALGTTFRFLCCIQSTGGTGTMSLGPGIIADSGALITPGSTWHFHAWYRDDFHGACTTGANLTNLLSVTFSL